MCVHCRFYFCHLSLFCIIWYLYCVWLSYENALTDGITISHSSLVYYNPVYSAVTVVYCTHLQNRLAFCYFSRECFLLLEV